MTGAYTSFVDETKAGQGSNELADCWTLEGVEHEVAGKNDEGKYCLHRHGNFRTPSGEERKVRFSITASTLENAETLLQRAVEQVVTNGSEEESIHIYEQDEWLSPISPPYVSE